LLTEREVLNNNKAGPLTGGETGKLFLKWSLTGGGVRVIISKKKTEARGGYTRFPV